MGASRSGQWQFERLRRLAPTAHTCRWAVMRPIFLLIFLVCCGCTSLNTWFYTHVVFHEGETQLGVIPRQPGTNFVLRTTLPRGAKGIRLLFASEASASVGRDRMVIMLTNRSTSGEKNIILYGNPGAETNVVGRASAELYHGSLKELLGGRYLTLETHHRTSCELHFQFSSAPKFAGPVRVTCHYAYGGVG